MPRLPLRALPPLALLLLTAPTLASATPPETRRTREIASAKARGEIVCPAWPHRCTAKAGVEVPAALHTHSMFTPRFRLQALSADRPRHGNMLARIHPHRPPTLLFQRTPVPVGPGQVTQRCIVRLLYAGGSASDAPFLHELRVDLGAPLTIRRTWTKKQPMREQLRKTTRRCTAYKRTARRRGVPSKRACATWETKHTFQTVEKPARRYHVLELRSSAQRITVRTLTTTRTVKSTSESKLYLHASTHNLLQLERTLKRWRREVCTKHIKLN